MAKTSRISGFHKLSVEERLKIVREFAQLSKWPCSARGDTWISKRQTE
jgi:hypothetical protein